MPAPLLGIQSLVLFADKRYADSLIRRLTLSTTRALRTGQSGARADAAGASTGRPDPTRPAESLQDQSVSVRIADLDPKRRRVPGKRGPPSSLRSMSPD